MAEERDAFEKEVKAGLLALLTVAIQIRDEKKGSPVDQDITDARQLIYKIRAYV